jgi:hypothetical protein
MDRLDRRRDFLRHFGLRDRSANVTSPLQFLKGRALRLYPAAVFCATLTFADIHEDIGWVWVICFPDTSDR